MGTVGLAALAAATVGAGLLGGCNQPSAPAAGPTAASAPSASSSAGSGGTAASGASASPQAAAPGGSAAGQRCHTGQLSAHLAPPSSLGSGQTDVPLVYTNTSRQSCVLHGVPGLDLRGPADPNGPVYSLRRQDNGGSITLAPGASASARVVVLSYEQGSIGSEGSTVWTPNQLVTIPPGETTPLTVAWPAKLTVLRQDEATHPGSWVESFTANPR